MAVLRRSERVYELAEEIVTCLRGDLANAGKPRQIAATQSGELCCFLAAKSEADAPLLLRVTGHKSSFSATGWKSMESLESFSCKGAL